MSSFKCSLAEKNCIPCSGATLPLNIVECTPLMQQLGNGWRMNDFGHLWKKYGFADFQSAMDFANKIAAVAEKNWHHPNILISWGVCEVEIWTHKIDGLSLSDFYLAAKIDLLM